MIWYGWQFLLRQKRFTGIDIGRSEIKLATVTFVSGVPEVVALLRGPSPPGVWQEQGDDELLVSALKDVAEPDCGEVVTAVGEGVARIRMATGHPAWESMAGPPDGRLGEEFDVGRTITAVVPLDRDNRTMRVEVSSDIIYRCYSIFARAGLSLQAIDLNSLALWRLLGRDTKGVVGIADLGAGHNLLLIVAGGYLREVVTGATAATFGYPMETRTEESGQVAAHLWQLLVQYREREGEPVDQLLLTGDGSRLSDIMAVLRQYGLKVTVPVPRLRWAPDLAYDPVFAVALGLALKGVTSGGG